MYKVRLAAKPHEQLLNHIKDRKMSLNYKNIKLESIGNIQEQVPYQNFLRNEQHICAQSDPLDFRSLPRDLKVFFPGPPKAPPPLEEIPYTYEKVELVPVRMPRQRKGTVGSWVLEESGFIKRRNSCINEKKQSIVKRIRTEGSQSNIKQSYPSGFIQNRKKSIPKSSQITSNSVLFFQMVKAGRKQVQFLLQANSYLAYNTDQQKMTALHITANSGYSYLTKVLLQKFRANPVAKDAEGRTPLHLAVAKRHISCMVRIFIEGGELKCLDNQKRDVFSVTPDANTKHLLEKLEEVKFIIRSKGIRDIRQYRIQLERHIKYVLGESSIYFQ